MQHRKTDWQNLQTKYEEVQSSKSTFEPDDGLATAESPPTDFLRWLDELAARVDNDDFWDSPKIQTREIHIKFSRKDWKKLYIHEIGTF